MKARLIANGVHAIPLGGVNVFLVDGARGLTLIDTGFAGKADAILKALSQLGRAPGDLRHIVLTHAHIDHIGSLAALVRATGAQTWIHRLDAPIAERGSGFRLITPARIACFGHGRAITRDAARRFRAKWKGNPS